MNTSKKYINDLVEELAEKYELDNLDKYKLSNTIILLNEDPERVLYVFEISDKLKEVLEMHNYNVIYERNVGYRINYTNL